MDEKTMIIGNGWSLQVYESGSGLLSHYPAAHEKGEVFTARLLPDLVRRIVAGDAALARHEADTDDEEDICGLCGEPGADKAACPVGWPGQRTPATPYVHSECEEAEACRAMEALTPGQRAAAIREASR